MQIAILGRQHKLSLAELESIFGDKSTQPLGDYAALIDSKALLPQERLGGTIKSATVIARLEKTNLDQAFSSLPSLIAEIEGNMPEGKLQLGVSVYGYKAQRNWLLRQMLQIKKQIKKSGRSVRIIENKSPALEAAQILYNKLTGPLGLELLIIKDSDDTIIARATGVQDIDAYAERDHGRPKRDAYVGMLPPKLAQIMINLAAGDTQSEARTESTILDPFCGTGVVLQEALLAGYLARGSDVSDKMVSYSQENLQWLSDKFDIPSSRYNVEQGDATSHDWKIASPFVVCETYLGKPLTSLPKESDLGGIINESNSIAKGFLMNISAQLGSGSRLCVGLPAWHIKESDFRHLPVIDELENLGYKRLSLSLATNNDLIYHRSDQVVGRELVLLQKI